MKKSQTTSKSSAKTAKLSAKKTLKKPSRSKTEKKKEVGAKASAPRPKALAKKKLTPVSPAKASAKKSVAGKTTKTVKNSGSKKSLKSVKETTTKLSRPKAKAKPVEATSIAKAKKLSNGPEIKKKVASKYPVKKPVKSSEKITKTKKTPGKETVKTTSAGKSLTPGKKPAKKSPAKTLAPITKIKQKTTVKATGTKKPSAEKVKKVVARKSEEKTVKSIKVAASAEGGVKTEKSIAGKLKPAPEKKTLTTKTAPQIKMPVMQKLTLKPIETEKEVSSLSPRRKTVREKGTSSLLAAEPLLETSQKTAATYVASSQAETKQKKSAKLKIFLPEEELPPEETRITPSPKLPEEYGENELLLMEVDPAIVFVSWEIKPDDISLRTGKLTLRVYDVTGLDFDGSHANRFFDITLSKRVDSKFIDIKMPGRDVIMEIGLLQPEGSFEPIKRSNRVSMPALRTLEELGITGALSGSNTLIGY